MLEDFIIYKMSLVSIKYKCHINIKVAKNLKYIRKNGHLVINEHNKNNENLK